jgi:hypothetical protein
MTTAPNLNIGEEEVQVIYCHRRNCPGSTGLRCYQTDVPICMKCAVRTPVGYISKDAARERQKSYFNIQTSDYVITMVVSFFATLFVGVPLVFAVGFFWYFMLFVAPAVGGAIGELTYRAIGRRRGRYTPQILIGAMASAGVIILLVTGDILGTGLFSALAIGTALTRIRVTLRL